LGALLAPGWRETRRLADLNARITRLDTDVRAAERVLQDLERNRRLLATIQSLENSSVRPLPLLRELTELLPNDAWLTLLSADTKGVELIGQASAAAALIPLLENSPRRERAGAGARAGADTPSGSRRAEGGDYRRAGGDEPATGEPERALPSRRHAGRGSVGAPEAAEGHGGPGVDRRAQRAHPAAGRARRSARDPHRDRGIR